MIREVWHYAYKKLVQHQLYMQANVSFKGMFEIDVMCVSLAMYISSTTVILTKQMSHSEACLR